ncbi:breakpoint cluster region protein-like [Polypterus senegalus]|uniref:breakpoint cluster region protein-like n=1 Tax=Polypterus senegalus TaxID=55291 RepID=UPI001963F7ED|nr:breakpoint cluster region protein-like [Polypterus senegalus]XP_039602838.1 breakpoint cluster region protein-like [Polypterus senegalus]
MELYSEAVNYLQEYGVEVAKKEQEDLEEVFDVDDEFIPSSSSPRSLLRSDSIELLEVPGNYDSESMLRKRMVVLKSILDSEQLYLYELETLMMPIKALKATACTSQPVLTEQQIQTVFFQVPELLDLHRAFYESLKERVELGESSDSVGELFQKMVSQLCTYRGFIDNYENAVQTVHKCMQTDERFKTLAEDMSCKQTKAKYTIEALLYKPLDRVTKTTLVLHVSMQPVWMHVMSSSPYILAALVWFKIWRQVHLLPD